MRQPFRTGDLQRPVLASGKLPSFTHGCCCSMQPLRQSCREILPCTLMLLPKSDEHQVTAFARTEVVLSTLSRHSGSSKNPSCYLHMRHGFKRMSKIIARTTRPIAPKKIPNMVRPMPFAIFSPVESTEGALATALEGCFRNGRNSPRGDAIGFQTLPSTKLAWQFQHSECS